MSRFGNERTNQLAPPAWYNEFAMKNAYTLLGLLFVLVFGGAYVLFERTHAPAVKDELVITNDNEKNMSFTLTTPAFENGGLIPSKFTCDGLNINPELHISKVPEGTQSLVLVMDDPDIPEEIKESRGIEKFDHWVLYNILAATTVIPEGYSVGSEGLNSVGDTGYIGACPPAEYEPKEHRYIFRLYALSGNLNFIKAPTLDEVETAAKGSMLGSAELVGRYQRQ